MAAPKTEKQKLTAAVRSSKTRAKAGAVMSPLKADSGLKGGKVVASKGKGKAAVASGGKAAKKPAKPRAAKQAAVEKQPVAAAPGKYEKRFIGIARLLFLAKVSDEEIAKTIGIDVETMEWWKEEHPEFDGAFRPDRRNYGGRPSEYDESLLPIAHMLGKLGATDLEIAQAFEKNIRTIYRWKLEHPEFAAALDVGKDEANQKVAQSLYKRATGYSFDSEKIVVVNGEPERVETIEHVPPDSKAAIYWLQNRDPENWRAVQHIKHDVPPEGPLASFLSKLGAQTFMPAADAAETVTARQKPNQIMPQDGADG